MMQASLWVRLLLVTAVLVAATACEKKHDDKREGPAAPTASAAKKHDCEEEHGHPAGPPIELGTTACGAFTVKAEREHFPMKPGCDAPIDVWLTGGSAKVVAVRFWVGLEDAKASIKANEPDSKPQNNEDKETTLIKK